MSLIALYQNISLVYNPCAGRLRGRARLVERVAGALKAAGHGVSCISTEGPATAGSIARERVEAGADLILALGGDGTINELLSGVAHSQVPVAIIPAGTANVLARELGLRLHPLKAVRRLGEFVPQRVALGLLRAEPGPVERYFLLMAGVGFDAHIVYRLNLGLKSKFGEIAYWVSAMRQMARSLEEFEVEVAGERFRRSFALVSRVRNYAGYMQIAQRVSLIQSDFEVVLFEGTSPLRHYLRYFGAVIAGRTSNLKGMSFLHAKQVKFPARGGPCVYVQVDGEYAGRLPASVEIVPDALTLLVPPDYPRSSQG